MGGPGPRGAGGRAPRRRNALFLQLTPPSSRLPLFPRHERPPRAPRLPLAALEGLPSPAPLLAGASDRPDAVSLAPSAAATPAAALSPGEAWGPDQRLCLPSPPRAAVRSAWVWGPWRPQPVGVEAQPPGAGTGGGEAGPTPGRRGTQTGLRTCGAAVPGPGVALPRAGAAQGCGGRGSLRVRRPDPHRSLRRPRDARRAGFHRPACRPPPPRHPRAGRPDLRRPGGPHAPAGGSPHLSPRTVVSEPLAPRCAPPETSRRPWRRGL